MGGLVAFLAQAYGEDLDDTTVGLPSFWQEREALEARERMEEMAPARFALAAKKKAAKAKKLAKPKKAAPKKASPKKAPKKAKASKKAEELQGDWTLPLVALVSLFAGGVIEGRCARYFRRSAAADDYSLAEVHQRKWLD